MKENIERIFNQENRNKKIISHGIHNRASRKGYIRGGIKTAYDFMTTKERKKLNGKVITYNMYDVYKDINNCDLNEILTKDSNEINKILTVVKENNSCKQICDKFNVSNSKLYSLYDKYNVEYTKRPVKNKKENVDLSTVLITKDRFLLMNSFKKGEYLVNIVKQYNIQYAKIARYYSINKNNLAYYVKFYRNKTKENDNKVVQYVTDEFETKEIVKQQPIEENLESNIIQESECITEEIKEIAQDTKEQNINILNDSKFKIELNSIYDKNELINKMLMVNNILYMLSNDKQYKAKIVLEEV